MTTAIAKPISKDQLRAIHALWREVSPGLGTGDSGLGAEPSPQYPAPSTLERQVRLAWISNVVLRPLSTSTDLSREEAQRVIERMKQEVGQEWRPAGRGWRRNKGTGDRLQVTGAEQTKIAELAAALWGGGWPEKLAARLSERFAVPSPQHLTPRQGRMLVEELLQRIAVGNLRRRLSVVGSRLPETTHDSQPTTHTAISRAEIEREKQRLREKFFGHRDAEGGDTVAAASSPS